MDARRRFVISCALLLGFVLIGTLGYIIIEGASPFDAAYMSVITISTVGYFEIIELSSLGRVFTMILIMLGVGSVFYATTSLVTLFIGGELRSMREKLKVQKRINKLKEHVIICGYGRTGQSVVDRLHGQQLDAVIIDNNPERIAEIEREGLLYVQGDASQETSLIEAGITRAKTLVATLPKDADNVYTVLTARGLNPSLVIITRAESTTTECKLLRAGADRVVCPQIIGATRISSLITRPSVVDFVDIAAQGLELEIDEYVVSGSSPLVGKRLRNTGIRQKADATVVAIKRANGQTVFNPSAEEALQAEDILILIGPLNTSERLAEL